MLTAFVCTWNFIRCHTVWKKLIVLSTVAECNTKDKCNVCTYVVAWAFYLLFTICRYYMSIHCHFFRKVDVVVIDEVSMLSAQLLDIIEHVFRTARVRNFATFCNNTWFSSYLCRVASLQKKWNICTCTNGKDWVS